MNRGRIRAVFFDAVGTLLHPQPDAATVYAEVGRRFGSSLDAETICRRFREAMARQDDMDRANGWRTSEQREVQRWRTIVAEVLDDTTDAEACFAALYQHFGEPASGVSTPVVAFTLKPAKDGPTFPPV